MTDRQRDIFDNWSKKILWALLVSVATYGVSEIKSISNNLQQLNITVTILSEKLNQAAETSKESKGVINSIESRVRELERECLRK